MAADAPLRPFHVAVPVHDLDAARRFYGGLIGCREGRRDTGWIDFDLYGHQFVCHLVPGYAGPGASQSNPVDGHDVPIPHYGVVLSMPDWTELAGRLRAAGVQFVIEPQLRFAGRPGEQGTLFLLDPSGNALEFKGFRDLRLLFEPQ